MRGQNLGSRLHSHISPGRFLTSKDALFTPYFEGYQHKDIIIIIIIQNALPVQSETPQTKLQEPKQEGKRREKQNNLSLNFLSPRIPTALALPQFP